MKVKIRSIQKYLPGSRVGSEELDETAGLRPGWIKKTTGVDFRYRSGETDSATGNGAKALEKALDDAGLIPADLDFLIYSAGSFDFPVPHNSCVLKSKITDDSVAFPCIDIDSTCLSFANALDVAHLYLACGRYKRIAIVSSELASRTTTPADPKIFGLFGDAAVAIIIESSETEGYTPGYTNFENYPSGAMYARIPFGGLSAMSYTKIQREADYYFQMDGVKLVRLILQHIAGFMATMEKNSGIKLADYDYVISHQTSKLGNDLFLSTFNLDGSNMVNTLHEYGNCVSCSIPLGLEKIYNDATIDIKGKNVLLFGTAAGVSLGCIQLSF